MSALSRAHRRRGTSRVPPPSFAPACGSSAAPAAAVAAPAAPPPRVHADTAPPPQQQQQQEQEEEEDSDEDGFFAAAAALTSALAVPEPDDADAYAAVLADRAAAVAAMRAAMLLQEARLRASADACSTPLHDGDEGSALAARAARAAADDVAAQLRALDAEVGSSAVVCSRLLASKRLIATKSVCLAALKAELEEQHLGVLAGVAALRAQESKTTKLEREPDATRRTSAATERLRAKLRAGCLMCQRWMQSAAAPRQPRAASRRRRHPLPKSRRCHWRGAVRRAARRRCAHSRSSSSSSSRRRRCACASARAARRCATAALRARRPRGMQGTSASARSSWRQRLLAARDG
jgi:hypothetical protein